MGNTCYLFVNFDSIVAKAKAMPPVSVCVAAAEDRSVLEALHRAAMLGIARPLLVGDAAKICTIAAEIGMRDCEIVDCPTPEASTAKAVEQVREGKARLLMKGMVNTSIFMRAILNREAGLRTGNLISLLAVYELPGHPKLIFGTDSGINTAPNLEQKANILSNALKALHNMGLTLPKVAILAANEMVDPKIPSTTDAKGLVEATQEGRFPPCVVEGPMALDVIFDKIAAEHKGIESRVSGDVDLLLFPNIETGNALGKSWLHFNKAKWAGIVLGAAAPVILGSRSDTAEIKLNSIAMGCLSAEAASNP